MSTELETSTHEPLLRLRDVPGPRIADDVRLLDPRTGADLRPPWPRWALPVMVAPAVLAPVLAAAGSLVGR